MCFAFVLFPGLEILIDTVFPMVIHGFRRSDIRDRLRHDRKVEVDACFVVVIALGSSWIDPIITGCFDRIDIGAQEDEFPPVLLHLS